MLISDLFANIINGGFFASYFFIPFVVFLLLKEYKWKVFLVGYIIPFSWTLLGGNFKEILWALILSTAGWLLARAILFVYNRFHKIS